MIFRCIVILEIKKQTLELRMSSLKRTIIYDLILVALAISCGIFENFPFHDEMNNLFSQGICATMVIFGFALISGGVGFSLLTADIEGFVTNLMIGIACIVIGLVTLSHGFGWALIVCGVIFAHILAYLQNTSNDVEVIAPMSVAILIMLVVGFCIKDITPPQEVILTLEEEHAQEYTKLYSSDDGDWEVQVDYYKGTEFGTIYSSDNIYEFKTTYPDIINKVELLKASLESENENLHVTRAYYYTKCNL